MRWCVCHAHSNSCPIVTFQCGGMPHVHAHRFPEGKEGGLDPLSGLYVLASICVWLRRRHTPLGVFNDVAMFIDANIFGWSRLRTFEPQIQSVKTTRLTDFAVLIAFLELVVLIALWHVSSLSLIKPPRPDGGFMIIINIGCKHSVIRQWELGEW